MYTYVHEKKIKISIEMRSKREKNKKMLKNTEEEMKIMINVINSYNKNEKELKKKFMK